MGTVMNTSSTDILSRSEGPYMAPASRRRGAVAVTVVVSLTVLLGFAALVIDGGRLYVARAELQSAADAAALASVQSLLPNAINNYVQNTAGGYEWASTVAGNHQCMGDPVGIVAQQDFDVAFGWLDRPTDLSDNFTTVLPHGYYNAVRVRARRTDSSPGGGVILTIAQVLGHNTANVSATAVAVLDDRFLAYKPRGGGSNLIPFTIQKSNAANPEGTYDYQKEFGQDYFGYDAEQGDVTDGSDGVPEVKLFPDKQTGSGKKKKTVPGNFGLLNIGVGNHGVPELEDQILNGVTAEQLTEEIGTSELSFSDESGNPVSYEVSGTPGIKAGIEDAVEERIGDVVAFLLYSEASGNGSNSVFTIVDIRFGRVMEVELSGGDKRIIVQPEVYQGREIKTSPDAPHSNLEVCRLLLAR